MKAMSKSKLFTLLLLLIFVPSGNAVADTITVTGSGWNFSNGEITVPYYITVRSGSTSASYAVACDSFFNSVSIPQSWTGVINTEQTLSQAKFGTVAGFDSVQAYTKAAWLYSYWENNPTSAVSAAVSFALWEVFAPAYADPVNLWEKEQLAAGFIDTGAAAYLAAANHWYASTGSLDRETYLSSLLIFTPSQGGNTSYGPQEFLATAPEPATLALFSGCLIGLAVSLRLKKARSLVRQEVRVRR